ncbi:hypothetical protein AGABI2DRAFT_199018 [Agaricus bisporus var. bisporus H97]|uniref:hypothetical protein n=1 Tax=Agaricus bisporus var. bisporus (strain H97 / ATCC MYA-4626 / FGSC 10389) TaxID=936046 RepID=UPI00029F5DE9|nr:hypothetical protein AGABI2DRAFT_199018 [Agaricus bisporus var. bisporus H97]EKV49886.1 hypothetical protein AGABI2DRAFT_199018 [Agaricus bisporus var. bisporus H97]
MAAIRGDNDTVINVLAKTYPVLVYDHRGMGDSSLSPKGDEEISIEMMARDLLFLLAKLGWEEIILCGHSMGGTIAQQLLVLPYHPTAPAILHFKVTHLLLIATRCKVTEGGGLPIKSVPGKPRSLEERKEGAKRVIAATLDPEWIKSNTERFNQLLGKAVNNNLWFVYIFH